MAWENLLPSVTCEPTERRTGTRLFQAPQVQRVDGQDAVRGKRRARCPGSVRELPKAPPILPPIPESEDTLQALADAGEVTRAEQTKGSWQWKARDPDVD
jgi:hypothetical protein